MAISRRNRLLENHNFSVRKNHTNREQTDDDGGTVIKHFTVLGNLLKPSSAEIQAAILDWGKSQVQRGQPICDVRGKICRKTTD